MAYSSHWREFDAQGARLFARRRLLRGGVVRLGSIGWGHIGLWLASCFGTAPLRRARQRWHACANRCPGERAPVAGRWPIPVAHWLVGGLGGPVSASEARVAQHCGELKAMSSGGVATWLGCVWGMRNVVGRAGLPVVGPGPWSRTTLDLAMPGHDPARLRPELDQAMQLQAGWRSEPMPGGWVGWRWGIQGELEQRRFDRSGPSRSSRNGRLIGVVRQPQTEKVGTSVCAATESSLVTKHATMAACRPFFDGAACSGSAAIPIVGAGLCRAGCGSSLATGGTHAPSGSMGRWP